MPSKDENYSPSMTAADDEAQARVRNITRGVSSLTAQSLANSVMAFIFIGALVRLLSPVQYGAYSAIQIATLIGAAFCMFGLQNASARYIAHLRQEDTEYRLRVRRLISTVAVLSLVLAAIGASFFVYLSPSLSLYFMKGPQWVSYFWLGAVWLASNSLATVFQGIIQGLREYALLAKISFMARLVTVVVSIGILWEYRDVSISIGAWVFFYAIMIVWMLSILRRDLSFKAVASGEAASILRYSFPIGLAGIMTAVANYADLIVVGGYLDPVALGAYNTAVILSTVLSLVLVIPLTTALLPEASHSARQQEVVSNGVRLAMRFLMLVVLPASILVSALSSQLIDLFSGGGTYVVGAQPLEFIALFYVFYAIQTVSYSLLQAIGHSFRAMVVVACAVGVDIAVSVSLVPSIGLEGAALAKVLASAVGMVVALWLCRGFFHRTDGYSFYLKSAVASAVPFLVVSTFSSMVSDKIITIVPYSLIGGLAFLGVVRVTKLLSEEDRRLLAQALPGWMNRYLRYV